MGASALPTLRATKIDPQPFRLLLCLIVLAYKNKKHHHEKTPKRGKNENCGGRGKKERICWVPRKRTLRFFFLFPFCLLPSFPFFSLFPSLFAFSPVSLVPSFPCSIFPFVPLCFCPFLSLLLVPSSSLLLLPFFFFLLLLPCFPSFFPASLLFSLFPFLFPFSPSFFPFSLPCSLLPFSFFFPFFPFPFFPFFPFLFFPFFPFPFFPFCRVSHDRPRAQTWRDKKDQNFGLSEGCPGSVGDENLEQHNTTNHNTGLVPLQ